MKRLLFTIGACIAFTALSLAQSWMPLGNGIQTAQPSYQSSGFEAVHYNGNLYVAYKEYDASGPAGQNLVVQVWDGQSWSQLPYTDFGNSGGVRGLVGFQGDLYVTGGAHILHKFDGNSWSQPLSSMSITGHSEDIEIHNGNIVIAGDFFVNSTAAMALEYDGSSWSSYPEYVSGSFHAHPRDIKSAHGDLYLVVDSDSLSPLSVNALRWDGSAWTEAAPNLYNPSLQNVELSHLGSLGNKLFAVGTYGLFEIRNDSLILKSSFSTGYFYGSTEVEFNGELYFAGYPSQTFPSSIFKTDGNSITSLANLPAINGSVGELVTGSGLLYATGGFTDPGSNGYDHAMWTTGNFSSLTGKVYLDDNSNCTFDSSEPVLQAAMLTINPGNIKISTDQWGKYSVGVNAGSYTIDNITLTNSLHTGVNVASCNSLPASINVSTGASTATDFASEISGPQTDAAVVLSGFTGDRARFGFTENYQLKVQNRGATALSGLTTTLEVPANLSISSATPTYDSYSGNTYTWNISSLNSLEEFTSTIALSIDTSVVNMGDSLRFVGEVTGASGDAYMNNNADSVNQEVVGAIDPNDKQANKIIIQPGANQLEYLIRFQNTGNDTAYKVVIKDELESRLELEKLQILASSHNYEVSIDDRTLTWTFNNILLPDSGANYQESQGFVRFIVGLDAGIQPGDTLHNDADIFFDFQEPVHTNEARTAVVSPISIDENRLTPSLLEVYPNPAVEEIHIRSNSSSTMKLRLFDMSGKVLATFLVKPQGELTYNINGLSTGVYFIQSETETYRIVVK